jgi:hypothetical protein
MLETHAPLIPPDSAGMKIKASPRVLFVSGLFISSLTAQAQLGWTLEQCKTKYGEPKMENGDNPISVNALGQIEVFFLQEKYVFSVTLTKSIITYICFHKRGRQKERIANLVDSGEVKSLAKYTTEFGDFSSNIPEISKEYDGIAWKGFPEIADGTFVGYRHGTPKVEISINDNSIDLEETNADELAAEIMEAND